MRTIEAILGSPPHRDELVVQFFERDRGQWGELYREQGRWWIDLYPKGQSDSWKLDAEEVIEGLEIALRTLKSRLENA